jgi:hypothetical protein
MWTQIVPVDASQAGCRSVLSWPAPRDAEPCRESDFLGFGCARGSRDRLASSNRAQRGEEGAYAPDHAAEIAHIREIRTIAGEDAFPETG